MVDRIPSFRHLSLRLRALARSRTKPPRRRPDDGGAEPIPATPDPNPKPLIGGAAAEID